MSSKLSLRNPARTFVGLRDYVMLLLMYDTGLRLQDILRMCDHDINFNDNSISISPQRKNKRGITVVFVKKKVHHSNPGAFKTG